MERIPENKARQGGRGYRVLLVLVTALALAAAVWLVLEFYGEAIDAGSAQQPGAVDTSGQPAAGQSGERNADP